jgi:hypothetical protein
LILNLLERSCSLIDSFIKPCLDFVDDFKYLTVHCFFDLRAYFLMFWVRHNVLKLVGSLIRVRYQRLREVKLKVEVLILVKDQLLWLRGIVRLLERFLNREIWH